MACESTSRSPNHAHLSRAGQILTQALTPGTLYLVPVTLGGNNVEHVLPADVIHTARELDTFIVENEKSARQFLGLIKTAKPIRELNLLTLNEHTAEKELPALLAPLLNGRNV